MTGHLKILMARVWQPYHLSVTNVGSNLIIKYTVLVWSECGIIGASKPRVIDAGGMSRGGRSCVPRNYCIILPDLFHTSTTSCRTAHSVATTVTTSDADSLVNNLKPRVPLSHWPSESPRIPSHQERGERLLKMTPTP